MRPFILFATVLGLAGCSADTNDPPPQDQNWDDPYDDDWDNPADDPNDHGDGYDDPNDDQDDEDVVVPGEADGPAHHSEVEPNDDIESPTYIGVPDCSADAALEGDDDNDWFSVRIEEPGPYVFLTMTGEPDDDEATDTRLEVFDAFDLDDPIASDDDAGEGSASRLTADLREGVYYIHVYGYTTATQGEYEIHVVHPDSDLANDDPTDDGTEDDEPLELPDAQEFETESNGTLESADSLGSAPWTIEAELDARDIDHFAFLAEEGQMITATTGSVGDGADQTDTVIEILDADGRSLGEDDDGADEPMFSRLTVDLPEAGIYYVKVVGYSESTHGSYSLSIE